VKQIFILALAAVICSGCFSKINQSVNNAATEAIEGDDPLWISIAINKTSVL
jgi:hypothetical protein